MNIRTKEFPARLKTAIADSFNFEQALKRLKYGKEATPRSWVYEDKDPEWILKTWEAKLRTLTSDKELKFISEWDLSKKDKFAPQGQVAAFSERLHTLEEYWNHLDFSPVFNSKEWKMAITRSIRLLGFNHTGVPKTVDAVISKGLSEDKYNTSSGDPLFIKRRKPEAQAQARAAVLNGTWDKYYPVLGSRASMGKTGSEARWIFMFPMAVNLQEQRFQQPLQEYIRSKIDQKSFEFFLPWDGYNKVQQNLSHECVGHTLKFGCDYTKMDQHFNFHHALQCFEVIKHYFNPEYWNDLYRSIHYTFFCDVVGPDSLLCGPHAMPSGSGWTNFLETVFNFILKQYIEIKYGIHLKSAMGIGDDQLWVIIISLASEAQVKKFSDFIVEIFKSVGLDANPDKQEVSYNMASFLQRRSYEFWSPDNIQYAGVYPTIRALTSEIYPEFYHNEKEWTRNTFALRCLMILENCVNHPLFKEFCIFIANGNKNIIEFAKLPDAEILLTRHLAKKIANFIPTYNQEKMEVSPTQFKSLQIIREYAMKK